MQPLILTNAFRRPRATRLSSGVKLSEDTNVYACVEEMVDVIHDELRASPLLLPTLFDPEAVTRLLQHVDGIFLPGAVSNIHPSHYGAEVEPWPQVFDRQHDDVDMFLVRQARDLGIPFFGICRSMQAMNLVFGGTLNQHLEEKGPIDHACSNPCNGQDDSPGYMHDIVIEPGGLFARHFSTNVVVNSMHEQAIDRLGSGLKIEARALDGVIEAISWPGAPNFFVAVQWHPEALPKHAVSQKLFGAFSVDIEKRLHGRQTGC
jgi:putative glutamine amidotransferase